MSADQFARNIISRHDPENDIIPNMDNRVSWAENNLAEAILLLLARIEELESKNEKHVEENYHEDLVIFSDIRLGEWFMWGTIKPHYQKVDETTAIRQGESKKLYFFSPSCLVKKETK